MVYPACNQPTIVQMACTQISVCFICTTTSELQVSVFGETHTGCVGGKTCS